LKAAALACLVAGLGANQVAMADDAKPNPYPAMAPIEQYRMARADEIALARSAGPASLAEHAEVLVMGEHGYETAVKGTNGFVCFVGRSWAMGFDNPEFWNPKIRSALCVNEVFARTVDPIFLARAEWVLAGVSRTEMKKREAAAWSSGQFKAPEPGAMSYMMARGGYINDGAGHWHPHVMLFVPRTNEATWGADAPDSPVAADSINAEKTTIFSIIVPEWSDGTPAPMHH
jgi:hypothetical protein